MENTYENLMCLDINDRELQKQPISEVPNHAESQYYAYPTVNIQEAK
ncbi:hypothetical protein HYT32_01820 [Candidatus Roizmanbacteria bacterium]|nr:hypothetical protein [Candidatus Roizmanbacteria bacterium]